MKKTNNKGFSLVELIIVVAIMAILIGVLAPQYIKYVEKSSIEAFFAVNIKQKQMEANGSDSLQMEANGSNSPTMEANGSEWKQNKLDLKDLIKEALTEQQSQLMKPI